MTRFVSAAAVLAATLFMVSACATSDPNIEGAKLDIRNQDWARALENIETALERNPNNAEAHLLKGDVLREQALIATDDAERTRLYREMAESYQQAISNAGDNAELTTRATNGLRQAYYEEFRRGSQAFNKGREDEAAFVVAIDAFSNAAIISPDSADAYVNQGYSLINAGRATEAIQPLRQAVEQGADDPDVYVLLADLYSRNNQSSEAVTLLRQAQTRFPDNAEIRSGLLNAYVASGQADQALAEYQQAVQNEPDNKLYRYNYGSLLLQSEQYDEAIEQLRAATELDDTYGSAFYNLGAAYVNKAVDINDEISRMDDELRAQRSTLSQADIRSREAEMDRLAQERRGFFQSAIQPLERAKELYESAGESAQPVCQALYQAYVQTNELEKAEAISECAGYGN